MFRQAFKGNLVSSRHTEGTNNFITSRWLISRDGRKRSYVCTGNFHIAFYLGN
jgi:hypothetical protein